MFQVFALGLQCQQLQLVANKIIIWNKIIIELSSHDGRQVHFNAMVTLSLSHSAPNLRGYEVVIKKQINKETNEWEDVRGTKNLSCRQGIKIFSI